MNENRNNKIEYQILDKIVSCNTLIMKCMNTNNNDEILNLYKTQMDCNNVICKYVIMINQKNNYIIN